MSGASLNAGPARTAGQRLGIAVLFCVAAALAACRPDGFVGHGSGQQRVSDASHIFLTDPSLRHPITVEAGTAVLELPGAVGSPTARFEAQVATLKFLREFRDASYGDLNVTVHGRPSSSPIQRRLRAVEDVARAVGIPRDRIKIRQRGGRGDGVTLSYNRIAAVAPECGDWSENVADDRERLPYPNFGCAQQRNLAAMMANPTDLAVPAPAAPRQSDQRADQFKKFKEPPTADGPKTLTIGQP